MENISSMARRVEQFSRRKKRQRWRNDTKGRARQRRTVFFLGEISPTFSIVERNFRKIDGAMYRDDERAPISRRKSGRNLEKQRSTKVRGQVVPFPWLRPIWKLSTRPAFNDYSNENDGTRAHALFSSEHLNSYETYVGSY